MMMEKIQMRRKLQKSTSPSHTWSDPDPFTSSRDERLDFGLLSPSQKISKSCSSWTILLRSRMKHSNSTSTCLGMMFLLLLSIFLGEIGHTFGAANPNPTTTTTTDLPSILDRVGSSSHGGHHKCYVCLPPDKTSPEAQDILKLFKDEGGEHKVKDCAGFASSQNKKAFEFKCPTGYRGCLLRIHGANVSRSCAQFEFNDCKVANTKELCFCKGSLCNEDKENITPGSSGSLPPLSRSASGSAPGDSTSSEERSRDALTDEQDESESRKFWQKGETDDEDLLEMADDTGSSGDGDGPYPPGVIDAYTTTPKPTLVPNIRGDKPKTTLPPPTAGGRGQPGVTISISASFLLLLGTFHVYLCSHLVNQYDRP